MKPLVSVITPLYNYERYIQRCIDSVLNQSYEHLEMIIVDDGSTDQGPDIVKSIQDPRVTFLQQPRNGYGVTRAVNTGIKASKGEFLCWLSADDYYLENHIQCKLNSFEHHSQANPNVKAVYSDAMVEVLDPDILKTAKLSTSNLTLSDSDVQKSFAAHGSVRWNLGTETMTRHEHLYKGLFGNPINGCSTLIHRSVYEQLGGFRHSWPLTHDFEMWLRYTLNGLDWAFDTQATSVSRYHQVNTALYSKDVPQETGLVIRSLAHYLSPHQLFLHPKIKPDRFYLSVSEILRHHYMLDGSALLIEKAIAHGEILTSSDREAYQQALSYLPQIDGVYKSNPPLGLVLAITNHSCNIRLRSLLTECLKMATDVPIYCWLEPENAKALESRTRQIFDEVQAFLGTTTSSGRLQFVRSDLAESLVEYGGIYLPLGTFEALEQRLMYLYHHLGLVIYHAESDRLNEACRIYPQRKHYYTQSLHQALMGIHQPFAALGDNAIFDGHQEYTYSKSPRVTHTDLWVPNDATHIKLKPEQRHVLPVLSAEIAQNHQNNITMNPFIPGAVLGTPIKKLPEWLGDAFERHFLCVYHPQNHTGWQDVLSQFLCSFKDQGKVCLMIRVPQGNAAETVEEDVIQWMGDQVCLAAIDVIFEQDFDNFDHESFSLMIQSEAILCPLKNPLQHLHLYQEVLSYQDVVPTVINHEMLGRNLETIFENKTEFRIEERLRKLVSFGRFQKPEIWWAEALSKF